MSKSFPFACALIGALFAASVSTRFALADEPLTASVVCDAEPVETGLKLDRTGVSAASVNVDDKETACWASRYKSVLADEWARSFLITVDDQRFREGKMPSVDIDVTYMLEANTKVELVADTKSGSRVIGAAWGNKKGWQTLHCSITDAYFGSRDFKNDPKKLPSDGFDLRLNGWAGDFFLRSVVVHGHDAKHPDNWSQFITIDSGSAASGTKNLIVAPGGTSKLPFTITNNAQADADLSVEYVVLDGVGNKIDTSAANVSVAAGASLGTSYTFDSKKLPIGEYSVRALAATRVDAKVAAAIEQPVVIAGPNDAFIVFDQVPIMQGMDFDRTAIGPKQVEVAGVKHWVWSAGFGSQHGADGYWNTVMMNMTDPKFRNAALPVVDITLNYRHEPNAPLSLVADTASGSRSIGGGWGRNPGWQSIHAQVDDALFNQTDYHSDPKAMKTDGFDLRFNACTGNAEIRSVFVHAYDLDHDPDYRRLLRFDGVDAGRELNVFAPNEKQSMKINLRNLANVPAPADVAVSLLDDLTNTVWTRSLKTSIGHGKLEIPIDFDTAGLKQGGYTFAVDIFRKDATDGGPRTKIFNSSTDLLVAESGEIAKAGEGEFLYGVDPGVGFDDDHFFQWLDFMGADITRGNGANSDASQWPAAFAAYDKHHLKASVFFDIPWDADDNARANKVQEVADKATAALAANGDHIVYIELGNEPDLDFFYAGPIEQYVAGLTTVSRAIKAASPKAIVMNGGLSFAGTEGDRRARKFIELVSPDDIDVLAYHGHGPGVEAERNAYLRAHACAKQFGKADKPMMDTESGVAANTPAQLRIQSRTAVQKEVYAQSVGLKALMWFRLLISGSDEAYTNLKNVHEPRPAILSYRTMVKTLRGLKFARLVTAASADQELYLFSQPNGTRRALVAWANARGGDVQLLKLAAAGNAVTDVTLVDLFGNRSPLAVSSDGTVALPINADPAYVTWTTSDPADVVGLAASPLQAGADAYLTPGSDDRVRVTITNPSDKPLDATLVATGGTQADGIKIAAPQQPVHVAPHESKGFDIAASLSGNTDRIAWPQRWAVFTGLPADAVDPAKFKEIPTQIVSDGKTFRPQIAHLKDGKIDLAALAGGYEEKKEAIAFALLTAPTSATIQIGASADWWMDWFVNGNHAWGDLKSGNGTGQFTVLDHTFEAPVQAGSNLVAVRVLSGSQGWKIISGGPEEIAAAKAASAGEGHAITVELRQNDALLGRRRVTIRPRHVIAPLENRSLFDGAVTAWNKADPDGDLTETGIANEWAKQPDSSKWWHGDADLSARIWLRSDAQKLYVVAAVADDTHHPAKSAAEVDAGDSLRLGIAGQNQSLLQLAVADGHVFKRGTGGWGALDTSSAAAKVDRSDSDGITWYRIAIARSALPTGPLAINAVANDDDFGGHKQSCSWFPGLDDPAATTGWWQAVLKAK